MQTMDLKKICVVWCNMYFTLYGIQHSPFVCLFVCNSSLEDY